MINKRCSIRREKKQLNKKIMQLEKKLKDKEKEVVALTKALSKEKKANSKLEKAHQDLIKCQKDHKNKLEAKSSGNAIVSNKIGDEDNLKIEKVDTLQARLSENEEYLKDLRNDLIIEVIDPEDERLKALKTKLGDDVYKAVTTALIELNVCEPNKKTCPRTMELP